MNYVNIPLQKFVYKNHEIFKRNFSSIAIVMHYRRRMSLDVHNVMYDLNDLGILMSMYLYVLC